MRGFAALGAAMPAGGRRSEPRSAALALRPLRACGPRAGLKGPTGRTARRSLRPSGAGGLEFGEDAFGSEGEAAHPDSRGVVDGVGDGRGDWLVEGSPAP